MKMSINVKQELTDVHSICCLIPIITPTSVNIEFIVTFQHSLMLRHTDI